MIALRPSHNGQNDVSGVADFCHRFTIYIISLLRPIVRQGSCVMPRVRSNLDRFDPHSNSQIQDTDSLILSNIT